MLAWLFVGEMFLVVYMWSQESVKHIFILFYTGWSKIKKLFWELKLKFISMLTWFVLVLNVITGNDAVAIKPLDPAQVHAPVLYLSDLQLRRIWWFCSTEEQKKKKKQ